MSNFGKLNFSISLNPTAAFPLDAREYFTSLEDANIASQSAVDVGSTDGVYYIGQTIKIVEGGVAKAYIIQPDKTLKECTSVTVDQEITEASLNPVTSKAIFLAIKNLQDQIDAITAGDTDVADVSGNTLSIYKSAEVLEKLLTLQDNIGNVESNILYL